MRGRQLETSIASTFSDNHTSEYNNKSRVEEIGLVNGFLYSYSRMRQFLALVQNTNCTDLSAACIRSGSSDLEVQNLLLRTVNNKRWEKSIQLWKSTAKMTTSIAKVSRCRYQSCLLWMSSKSDHSTDNAVIGVYSWFSPRYARSLYCLLIRKFRKI